MTGEEIKRTAEVVAQALCQNPNLAVVPIETLRLDLVSSCVMGWRDPLGQIKDWFVGIFTSIKDAIIGGITSFVSVVWDWIKGAFEIVKGAISGAVSTIWGYIKDAISTIGEKVWGFIEGLWGKISGAISGVLSTISGFFSNLFSTLASIFGRLADAIAGAVSSISSVLSTVASSILGVLSKLGETILGALSSVASKIVDVVTAVAGKIGDIISKLAERIVEGVTKLGGLVVGGFERLVVTIWEGLKGVTSMVASGFEVIGRTLMGFVNAVIQLPERIIGGIVQTVWGALTWLASKLWEGLKSLASWLGGKIWDAITGFAGFIADMIARGARALWEILYRVLTGLWGLVEAVSKPLGDLVSNITQKVVDPFSSLHGERYGEKIRELMESYGISSPEYLRPELAVPSIKQASGVMSLALFFPLWGQMVVRAPAYGLKALARKVSELDWYLRFHLAPIGLGVETNFNISKALGASLWTFADELLDYVKEIGRGLIYGICIWSQRPFSRVLSYYARNILPVEIPPETVVTEFVRRSMPLREFDEVLKVAKYYWALSGYSDFVLRAYFSKVEELSIEVTDRFGSRRKVPLSLMYTLPDPADVATMMVRDIFATFDDFAKLYLARGMHEDIGAFYYFLRFRYPPMERLWQFTMRGISGLLWAEISPLVRPALEAEARRLKAGMPVSAIELNFQFQPLLSAFQIYAKWHDYFLPSWFRREIHGFNFTSDNQILIDTSAEIPTKIDQRWGVKWGLYELLSKKGVTRESVIKDFCTRLIEAQPASLIQLDLTNFSRTIQATGLHPYWVPFTAVAEAMNVLAEERTLLRTGFVGLFKEGFWDVTAIEKLLAGFIVSSFKVSYFDVGAMVWRDGWVNQPVMYLPPERRLIELRALMDRSLDVLKEALKDVSRGYREWIIPDTETFKSKMVGVIDSVNEFFLSDYRAITGVDLPPNLKLTYVEGYYKPYIKALDIFRDVYTIERTRFWTQRWLGWVMYRVATGYVTPQEYRGLVELIKNYAKLTPYETEFMLKVCDLMYGIAVKEYYPSPSAVASLAEYIVSGSATLVELLEKVMDVYNVPAEWRPIWRKYVEIRPVADDVKALINTWRRVSLYVKLPPELEQAVFSWARYIGYTDKELAILSLRNQIEEVYLEFKEQRREYIPTPATLATLVEYVPEARKYWEQVVKARKIPPDWQPIWAKYIDIRPLVDDVKRYFSRAERLYARFAVDRKYMDGVLQTVRDFLGYTREEIEFLWKTTELERFYNAWSELIGTVERMVDLSEYSPTASKWALGKLQAMIDSLPITAEEKDSLKKMWEEYIRNRPVKSEARTYLTQVINAYVEGLISKADFEKELAWIKQWGFSDTEIDFYRKIADVRLARKLRIPLIFEGD